MDSLKEQIKHEEELLNEHLGMGQFGYRSRPIYFTCSNGLGSNAAFAGLIQLPAHVLLALTRQAGNFHRLTVRFDDTVDVARVAAT